jgi:hypothetical protein
MFLTLEKHFIFNNKILSASFCGFVLAMLSVFLFKYYSKQDDIFEVIAYATGAATATFLVLTLMQSRIPK